MSDEQSAIVPIEFKSSIVAIGEGVLVTGLFNGHPQQCVALLHCSPEAGAKLAERLRRAAKARGN